MTPPSSLSSGIQTDPVLLVSWSGKACFEQDGPIFFSWFWLQEEGVSGIPLVFTTAALWSCKLCVFCSAASVLAWLALGWHSLCSVRFLNVSKKIVEFSLLSYLFNSKIHSTRIFIFPVLQAFLVLPELQHLTTEEGSSLPQQQAG